MVAIQAYYCWDCNRRFHTLNGINQHYKTSTAHRPQDKKWECEICDRVFASEYARHQHYSNSSGHPYCVSCKRVFKNENNLTQHMHSRIHMGNSIECPFCKRSFTTASGVTIHLESGTCSSGLDRDKINRIVQQMDTNNVITRPMLTMPGHDRVETMATDRAWNGSAYACYFCTRKFSTLDSLNRHIKSPVHEQKIYRCPKAGCGREYTLLSGLVQHVESESCGIMRFEQVQHQAQHGIQNMLGRMISG